MFKFDPLHRMISIIHILSVGGIGFFGGIGFVMQQLSLGGITRLAMLAFLSGTGVPAVYMALYHYGGKHHRRMVEKYEHITVNNMTEDIRKDVSNLSRKIVYWEVYGVMCSAFCIAAWMWQYDQDCDYGCRGPYNPQCE